MLRTWLAKPFSKMLDGPPNKTKKAHQTARVPRRFRCICGTVGTLASICTGHLCRLLSLCSHACLGSFLARTGNIEQQKATWGQSKYRSSELWCSYSCRTIGRLSA